VKRLLFVTVLFPVAALAADWVKINDTPLVQQLYDKSSVELHNGKVRVWLRFVYHEKQPGQIATDGKSFDNTLNQYYVDCFARKYQVLALKLYEGKRLVGQFQTDPDPRSFDEARPSLAITSVMNKICPDFATAVPARKSVPGNK
jgi:Surface-adhesin protein E